MSSLRRGITTFEKKKGKDEKRMLTAIFKSRLLSKNISRGQKFDTTVTMEQSLVDLSRLMNDSNGSLVVFLALLSSFSSARFHNSAHP